MALRRQALWPGAALVVLLAVLGVQAVLLTTDRPVGPDEGCPGPAGAGLGVLLLDFRKPLDAAWRTRPAELLREVALELPPATELRVYRVADDAAAPLALVDRLCAPSPATSPAMPDRCPPPNGLARGHEAPYCDRLWAAQGRIDELARQAEATAPNAYLVEAIDAVRRELGGVAGHRSLHVLSDMMQHAEQHSHLESAPADWRLPAFAGDAVPGDRVPVSIHYLPRADTTTAPEVRRLHQDLWREGLAAVGLAPRFHDQGATPTHDVGTPTRLSRLARQREDLARGTARLEDTLSRLDAARDDLREARIRADQEQRALQSRRDELRAQDAAEREELSAERAEAARLTAALASRAQDAAR